MIIFGQGLNRAHPNLIKIVNTIEKGNDVDGFMKEVFIVSIISSTILFLTFRCRSEDLWDI